MSISLAVVMLAFMNDRFYDEGYQDGYAHGRIHGLIEGRELGREKGFEMWEEIGFYEGFATMWKLIHESQGRKDEWVSLIRLIFSAFGLTDLDWQSYIAQHQASP